MPVRNPFRCPVLKSRAASFSTRGGLGRWISFSCAHSGCQQILFDCGVYRRSTFSNEAEEGPVGSPRIPTSARDVLVLQQRTRDQWFDASVYCMLRSVPIDVLWLARDKILGVLRTEACDFWGELRTNIVCLLLGWGVNVEAQKLLHHAATYDNYTSAFLFQKARRMARLAAVQGRHHVLDYDSVLFACAAGNNIAGMRKMRRWGATRFESALLITMVELSPAVRDLLRKWIALRDCRKSGDHYVYAPVTAAKLPSRERIAAEHARQNAGLGLAPEIDDMLKMLDNRERTLKETMERCSLLASDIALIRAHLAGMLRMKY